MMLRICTNLLVTVMATAAASAADMPPTDMIAGARGHPLLSRYAGAVMVAYLTKTYDETDLVAGKFKEAADNAPPFEKLSHAEGKITRIAYNYPQERSSLEVFP